jgi:hypothetical protein
MAKQDDVMTVMTITTKGRFRRGGGMLGAGLIFLLLPSTLC